MLSPSHLPAALRVAPLRQIRVMSALPDRARARPSSSSSSSSSSVNGRSRPARARFGAIPRFKPSALSSEADGGDEDEQDEDDDDNAGAPSFAWLSSYGHHGAPAETDDHPTVSSADQQEVERRVDDVLRQWRHGMDSASFSLHPPPSLLLARDVHIQYLLRSLELLPAGYASLDASRPWLVYWTLQSLAALSFPLPLPLAQRCLAFLSLCQHPQGGYAGGPSQQPHLAPTYAAVNALCLLSAVDGVGETAFQQVDRRRLLSFLLSMRQTDGSFSVCHDGECDTRGVYTAVSVASLCAVMTPRLVQGVAEFLSRCQTYEGGMGEEPGNEAHGGYTFCSLAALLLLGRPEAARLEGPSSVRQWAARRQMRREGGFSGRANKLVDGCYSFWVGALFPLLDIAARHRQQRAPPAAASCGFDHLALQRYVLLCGQSMTGGLRDKPGKGADLYHTCYCISGLSLGQWAEGGGRDILGGAANRLRAINPIFNLPVEDAERGLDWFARQEKPDESWS